VVLYVTAHPAFDFIEFAANLKKAFTPCKVVQFVKRFINFRDTVDPLLNTCSNTPGAENFTSFRYKSYRSHCIESFISFTSQTDSIACWNMSICSDLSNFFNAS
jgi:hypothetical protein